MGPDWIEQDGYEDAFFYDPLNFASFEMTGTHLRISIPAGAEHNQFNLHHAGVVHRSYMGSGAYEAKMDASIIGYQQLGLIFQNTNARTSMAFVLYSDGTNLKGFVERFSEVGSQIHKTTVAGTLLGHTIPVAGPFYIRAHVHDNPDPAQRRWVFEWSRDNIAWTKVFDAVYETAHPAENVGQIRQVGVFVGDQTEWYGAPDQPFTVDVDYFRFMLPEISTVHTRASAGRIELFWASVAGADSYQVFRSTEPNSGFSLVGTTSNPTLVQTGLQNGVRYYYYVVPRRGLQAGGASATVSAVPHVTVLDSVPSNGLVLALSADELAYQYSDGQPVTEWVNASGQGVVSATGSAAPTFISSGLNGLPTVRFDGVDDHLRLPDGFQDFTDGLSVFVVMRPTALQTHFKILLLGTGTHANSIGLGRGIANGYQFFTGNNSGSVDWFEAASGPVAGEASLISVLLEPGAANSMQYAAISKNSSLLHGDGVYVPSAVHRTANYIGNSYWNDGRLQGDISEVIIYNRLLDPTERSTVHSYIQQKYGIGSPAPVFPPPLGAPTNVLAAAADARVTLSWPPVLRAAGYKIFRRESTSGTPTLLADVTGNSHVDNAVINGRTYIYTIQAYKGSESATSAEASATPLAPPPLPPEIPAAGLLLALDATAIAQQLPAGQIVTTWPDASPLRNNAVAPSSGAPLLVENAIGGKHAMRFDGADDYLSLPSGFQDFTAGMSLYVVMRPTGPQTFWKFLALGNSGSADGIGLGRSSSTPGFQYYTANQARNFDWFSTPGAITPGEASLISVFQEGGTPNGVSYSAIHQNQNALAGDEIYVPPIVNRSLNLIAKSPWNDGNFGGDIAEILLYNRLLSAAERATVQNYINEKYGFAGAPAPFPPALAAPQNLTAAAGDAIVTLRWSPAPRATGYRLLRRTSGGAFEQIADLPGTNHTDSAVLNGQFYTYVVRAHRGAELSPASVEASATPLAPPTLAPGLPTTGLLLALDADGVAQQLPNGQPVTTWHDASQGRNNAVATGGAPVLIHNAIGSRAVLRFDGVDDAMQLPSGFQDFTSGMSLYVVMRPTGLHSFWKILALGNAGGAQGIGLGRSSSTPGFQYYTANQAGSFDWFSTSPAMVLGEASLLSVFQEAGTPNGVSYSAIHQNGNALAGDEVFVPPILTRSVNYIARSPWNDGNFAGDIAEILLYDRLLDAAERTTVQNYINQKYGFAGGPAPFPPLLAAPANLAAAAGNGTVTLHWPPATRALGYRVFRRNAPAEAFAQIADIPGTNYVDSAVANGQSYTYVIRAYRGTELSPESPQAMATPLAPPPLPGGFPASGLLLFLDADGLAQQLSSGQAVTTWLDSSPAGNNAVARTGAPVLIHNAIGSRAAVRFDGIDDAMQFPAGFGDFSPGMSMFIVYRPAVIQNNMKLLVFGNSGGVNSIGLSSSGTSSGFLYFTANAASYDWFTTAGGPNPGEASLISVLQEPGAPGTTSYAAVFQNGNFLGGDGVYVPQTTTRSANYLADTYWSDGRFQGDIAEVILYSRLLNSSERSTVHAYIQQKYGFGGTSGAFPPPLATPVNLVASPGDATVSLTWGSTPAAVGYRVYRQVGGSGTPSQIATVSVPSHTDNAVVNGQSYTYFVRAFNSSQESADSASASATPSGPPEPPAGVPVDGLILSLNANSLTGSVGNGQPVTVWRDASPARKNAFAPSGAPVFVLDGIGGQPSVRFDGSDDYLALPSGFDNFVNGFSLYMVVRPSAVQNYSKLLFLGNGTATDVIGLSRAGTTDGLLLFTGNNAGAADWFQTSTGLATGEAAAISAFIESGPANSSRFAEVVKNGVSLHQEEIYVPTVVTRSINYIGNSGWSGDGLFQGDIAEVLLYNRLLTPTEEAAIHSYFSQEYGISFP